MSKGAQRCVDIFVPLTENVTTGGEGQLRLGYNSLYRVSKAIDEWLGGADLRKTHQSFCKYDSFITPVY